MKKLIFLATEDWFVSSHFRPLLRRAREAGYDVAVAARDSGALADKNVRVIDMPFARGSLKPADLWRERQAVRALLRDERPDILHVIAMKPIALALAAGAHGVARVFALTGRGYMGVSRLRHVAPLIARGVRDAVAQGDALLVENDADRIWVDGAARLPADPSPSCPAPASIPRALRRSPSRKPRW
ncbi:MAG: glycosyltransferase [Terricaulis sp.]|nr:glycosyltransferase [Terricaulis sp.]